MTLPPAETLQTPLYAPEPRRLKAMAVLALAAAALVFNRRFS